MFAGSYATKNNNEFSDLDIYTNLNDPTNKFRRNYLPYPFEKGCF